MELLTHPDNIRPTIVNVRRPPRPNRPHIRFAEHRGNLLPPPAVRLCREEAFENAERGRQVHVFTREETVEYETIHRRPPAQSNRSPSPIVR